jgi:peptidoglycan/LPS O-acetylase OafA/YrhL
LPGDGSNRGVTVGRLGHVPSLDGLRGVAILLVVAVHATGYPPGGHLGVDLFFVLSGFLITTLLLEERHDTGRLSLGNFYARRARRLLPALVLLLVAYLTIDAAKGHDGLKTIALAGLYFGNAVQAFSRVNPLAHSGLEHLWSLAEEEQFYLLWPLLLPLVALSRRPVRVLAIVLAFLCVYRLGLALTGASHHRLYNGPDTHADGLVAGAAIAFLRQRTARFGVSGTTATIGIGLGLIALVYRNPEPAWDALGLPIAETACAIALIAVLAIPTWQTALSWAPLRWFGLISYSLYLWHYMLMWAFDWKVRPLAVAIAIPIAYVSTRWIEEPIRRYRPSARRTSPGLALSTSAMAVDATLDRVSPPDTEDGLTRLPLEGHAPPGTDPRGKLGAVP